MRETTTAVPPWKREFVSGDTLRGIGSLLVLTVHCALGVLIANGTPTAWAEVFGRLGSGTLVGLDMALWVFFGLSGYLIARPFVYAAVEGRRAPRLGGYLMNRALRIIPMFWIAVVVFLLLNGTRGDSPLQVLSVFVFLQEWTGSAASAAIVPQAWSISSEVAFYLAIPVAAALFALRSRRLADARSRARSLAVWVGVAWIGSIAIRSTVDGGFAFETSLPAIAYAFCPGVALAAWEAGGAERWVRRPGREWIPGLLLVSGLVLWAVHILQLAYGSDVGSATLTLSLGSGSLLAAPMVRQWQGRPVWRALDVPAMRWVGQRSYSIYILHFALITWISPWAVDVAPGPRYATGLVWLTALPLTLVIAAFTYRHIEMRFLRLKRWSSRARRPEVLETTTAGGIPGPVAEDPVPVQGGRTTGA